MFDHAPVSSQFVLLFGRLVAFLCCRPSVSILLYSPFADIPTPLPTDKGCHEVARVQGWKWVYQDNQDMQAKAVMRWTLCILWRIQGCTVR